MGARDLELDSDNAWSTRNANHHKEDEMFMQSFALNPWRVPVFKLGRGETIEGIVVGAFFEVDEFGGHQTCLMWTQEAGGLVRLPFLNTELLDAFEAQNPQPGDAIRVTHHEPGKGGARFTLTNLRAIDTSPGAPTA